MILLRVGKRPRWWHLHRMVVQATAGINRYEACRCGTRQVRRVDTRGYSPIDTNWVHTGQWTPMPTRGPRAPGSAARIRRTR